MRALTAIVPGLIAVSSDGMTAGQRAPNRWATPPGGGVGVQSDAAAGQRLVHAQYSNISNPLAKIFCEETVKVCGELNVILSVTAEDFCYKHKCQQTAL